MRTIKYAILYHLDVLLISAVISLALAYPVYQAGIRILPSTLITKLVISAGVSYLHYARMKEISIFYMNLNFDITQIRVIYILIDVTVYLLFSACAMQLR